MILYLSGAGRIALSLLMAGAWMVQQRTGRADWIAQHFFTRGVMASHHLIPQYADLFQGEKEWRLERGALPAHRARLTQEFRCAPHRDRTRSAPRPWRGYRICGCGAGAGSSSPPRGYSVTPTAANGASATTG